MTNLESLFVDSNAVEKLESDLFKFTPNIKFVTFSSNKINYVGEDLLTNFTSLSRIDFSRNKCIDRKATSDFENFKIILRAQCPDPEAMKQKFCSADLERHEEEIRNLQAEVRNIKKNCYNGLLDSSTRLLHKKSIKLKKCSKDDAIDGPGVTLTVLKTSQTVIYIATTVASPGSKVTKILDASGSELQSSHLEVIIDQQNALFLPINLGQYFPLMERLAVTYSGLFELDARSFLNMRNLVSLNFTGNKIVDISEDFFSGLVDLRELDLSHNNIEVIDENAFKSNKKLGTVKLNHNQLTNIDGHLFSNQKKLQKLYLNNNKLKYINGNFFTSLTALEVVDFSDNLCIDLAHPNATLKDMANHILNKCIAPIKVKCKENPSDEARCDVLDLKLVQRGARLLIDGHEGKVEKLLIVDQEMLFIPFKLSETLPKLVHLIVQQSKLTTLHKSDFEGLLLLQEIKIEQNNISLIEEGVFDTISVIKYLSLAHNNLKSLPPKIFSKLMKLETLILTGNQLEKFSVSLLPPKGNVIKDFHLQQNRLQFMNSEVLRRLRNADVIDLSNNLCINLKFFKSNAKDATTLKDLAGEIEFECAEDF